MSKRLRPGAVVAGRELVSVTGAPVRIPDPARLTHLQFRRFAGCPVCNLHLRSFARRHDEVVAAGVREVVLFHSPAGELLRNRHMPRQYGAPVRGAYGDAPVGDAIPASCGVVLVTGVTARH